MTRKKLAVYSIVAAALLASATAIAGRAYYTEYAYYDANGNYTGTITYPCYGPPIVDGNPTGSPVLVLKFSCSF